MIRKQIHLLLACMLCCCYMQAQDKRDSLQLELDAAIANSTQYDAQKLQRIQEINQSFKTVIGQSGANKSSLQYDFYQALYEEYKVYRFDTAYLYATNMLAIADSLKDASKTVNAKAKVFFVLVSAGIFNEAAELLKSIDVQNQPDSFKANFYALKARYYYDLADYTNDPFHTPTYYKTGGVYLDSALAFFDKNSFDYGYMHGLRSLKADSINDAYNDFEKLVKRNDLSYHQQAILTSTLSYIFFRKGNKQQAVEYQMRAAIADIKSSTKEVFAIYNLSQLLFEQGDFKDAANYIKKAIDDASFYGARQRKVQVSSIMPIIQSSQLNNVEQQKKQWILYASAVSLILILLALMIFLINRQNKKLKQAQKAISDAHAKLEEANTRLQHLNDELQVVNHRISDANTKLEEANKIKDEYVGYFFTSNAALFQRIEKFKTSLEEKIHYNKMNELKFVVNNFNVKQERDELLKTFDKAFLKLFPHFVEDFNKLLDPAQQEKPGDGELLNTDLRIYALHRLGIKDNEKIAEILEYSVKSIYAYRTKIRNKSIVSRDDFDKKVMEIRSI